MYVDLTDELVPFYAGKGTLNRLKNPQRNEKHRRISEKYGLNRVIVFESDDQFDVLSKEIEVIADAELNAYEHPDNCFACNFTRGGDGNVGGRPPKLGKHVDVRTREKIAKSLSGNVPWNKGRIMSRDFCEKNSRAQKGKTLTDAHKRRLRETSSGLEKSKETRAKISSSLKGVHEENVRRVIGDIADIWRAIDLGEGTRMSLSIVYGISYPHFCRIINRYKSHITT
jgi:hypothetical protein